jgi:hypothetical protein
MSDHYNKEWVDNFIEKFTDEEEFTVRIPTLLEIEKQMLSGDTYREARQNLMKQYKEQYVHRNKSKNLN